MKKFLTFLCAVMLVLGMVGSASAVPMTWTDTINFTPDILIPPTYSYYHNIADNGFESYFMNSATGNDQVFSYDLSISLYDDNVGTSYTFWGQTYTLPDGPESASIWTAGGIYTNNITLQTYTNSGTLLEMLGIVDIYADGTLNVYISSNYGDFYLDSSTLTAYGDNGDCAPCNPVPEPSTLLLMGIGLLGLVGYNRKRSKKS